jgi:hypothetical protein
LPCLPYNEIEIKPMESFLLKKELNSPLCFRRTTLRSGILMSPNVPPNSQSKIYRLIGEMQEVHPIFKYQKVSKK